MAVGIGFGPEINNLGGIAGQTGLGAGEPARGQQVREEALQTQQAQEKEQMKAQETQQIQAAGESEPPLTENLGQNINFQA